MNSTMAAMEPPDTMFSRATGCLLRVLPSKNLPRPKKWGSGMTKGVADPWMPPGGKLRPGEGPREAVERELKEETGLDLAALQPVLG